MSKKNSIPTDVIEILDSDEESATNSSSKGHNNGKEKSVEDVVESSSQNDEQMPKVKYLLINELTLCVL
jgi:hypothetical protein